MFNQAKESIEFRNDHLEIILRMHGKTFASGHDVVLFLIDFPAGVLPHKIKKLFGSVGDDYLILGENVPRD